ncbi:tetratricopeptide repeat protein [Cognatishimia activa]|uniref:Type IV pilus biogenesis/stability protein PilW n=1 Tax=Cognatishimia activa TaxID=1715691 RepID=A0A0P1ISE5_9RHOB|nr:tetratricopeptide repeat protein [Cognatishimia activa]CUI64722.1 type IV pilus biogenesis/stability protein PilW [Cognatishimia activa]CUK26399.1 type IV pilus biogenesis/stability protein PilW [Cognatishimia activa]
MRQSILMGMGLAAAVVLAGCQKAGEAEVDRALEAVNAIDGADLSDVMLTAADPNEAVAYFSRTLSENPDRIDIQRGLATSLVRAKRYDESVTAWKRVVKHPDSRLDDQVDLADALIRTGDWEQADKTLDAIPPTHETFKRYRLEAVVADSAKEWKKADSFYETAIGLTTRPAGVLNNWGYSKLTRGDFSDAERLFGQAIREDTGLFTAKNNLVLARAAQRNYSLPVVPMEQTERAQLLHTLALSAIKQGDVEIGKALLREAIDTHPQHFETAVRSLRALEAS